MNTEGYDRPLIIRRHEIRPPEIVRIGKKPRGDRRFTPIPPEVPLSWLVAQNDEIPAMMEYHTDYIHEVACRVWRVDSVEVDELLPAVIEHGHFVIYASWFWSAEQLLQKPPLSRICRSLDRAECQQTDVDAPGGSRCSAEAGELAVSECGARCDEGRRSIAGVAHQSTRALIWYTIAIWSIR